MFPTFVFGNQVCPIAHEVRVGTELPQLLHMHCSTRASSEILGTSLRTLVTRWVAGAEALSQQGGIARPLVMR